MLSNTLFKKQQYQCYMDTIGGIEVIKCIICDDNGYRLIREISTRFYRSPLFASILLPSFHVSRSWDSLAIRNQQKGTIDSKSSI